MPCSFFRAKLSLLFFYSVAYFIHMRGNPLNTQTRIEWNSLPLSSIQFTSRAMHFILHWQRQAAITLRLRTLWDTELTRMLYWCVHWSDWNCARFNCSFLLLQVQIVSLSLRVHACLRCDHIYSSWSCYLFYFSSLSYTIAHLYMLCYFLSPLTELQVSLSLSPSLSTQEYTWPASFGLFYSFAFSPSFLSFLDTGTLLTLFSSLLSVFLLVTSISSPSFAVLTVLSSFFILTFTLLAFTGFALISLYLLTHFVCTLFFQSTSSLILSLSLSLSLSFPLSLRVLS